jgi:phosphoserine aminotransferase
LFGGAQKNLGPAGVTIVIIRKDLIPEETLIPVPTMLKYKTHADSNSLYNTPPVYSIYIAGKVLKWLLSLGGLSVMEKINQEKAALLYDYLDQSKLFYGTAEKDSRSVMNVTFLPKDPALTDVFLDEAKEAGLVNLKGHRSVGGIRASLYNAMPIEGVKTLVQFMEQFEARYNK